MANVTDRHKPESGWNGAGLLIVCALPLLWLPSAVPAQSEQLTSLFEQYQAARQSGETTAAIELAEELVAAGAEAYGDGALPLADLYARLGGDYLLASREAEARASFTTALEITELHKGTEHPHLVPLIDELTAIALRHQDYAEAERLIRRSLGILSAHYGESHELVIGALRELQDLYVTTGQNDQAATTGRQIEWLSQAREASRSFPGADEDAPPIVAGDDERSVVRVFYGTNRAPTGKSKPSEYYGTQRGQLAVGYADVSIPPGHQYGVLETKGLWARLSSHLGFDAFRDDYILTLELVPLAEDQFHGALAQHVAGAASREVLVFVHGYNVSFDDAVLRAAQLAFDLDFDGTPMMYSWPSMGSELGYTADEASVRVSGRRLKDFLVGVVARSGASHIHLVAHSMGNRALIEALELFVLTRPDDQPVRAFDQIVFTAPDVDRDLFLETLETVSRSAARTTLYASQNDRALLLSTRLHGNVPRAGVGGDNIIVADGLDSIDMSAVEADILGHSYFAANRGAILDLITLLSWDQPPDQRCGMAATVKGGSDYWIFDSLECERPGLYEATVLIKRFGADARAHVLRRISGLSNSGQNAIRDRWIRILDHLESVRP